jgi:ribosomal-protein-serine acetyltransferase
MSGQLPDRVGHEGFEVRLWLPDDVPALHRAIVDNMEHLRRFMSWISFEPLSMAQRFALVEEWHARWESGGEAPMGMFCDGVVVGGSGYVRREGSPALEIGYWVHVDHLGHGYATRAAHLLTAATFASTGEPAVEIHHDKANVRSSRVPLRLGYQFMGERPDAKVAPAEVGIDCTWRMTRDEWPRFMEAAPAGPQT